MKYYLFLAIQLLATLVYSQKYHVDEDFNSGTMPPNWTTNAISGSENWRIDIDGSRGSGSSNLPAGNQNLDGTYFVVFDDDSLGNASLNNTAELITPIFDNSNFPITYLTFDYNFREVPNSVSDSFYVDIYEGSQWRRILSRGQDDCGNYSTCTSFPSAFLDISTYANDSCQIRFTYHDGDDWSYYVGGDNVQIWSPFAKDLSLAAIVEPKSSCNLSSSDSINVLIVNSGYETQQNFDIAFELNGNLAVVETVNDSIAYQDSLIYTFNNTGDFSKVGLHNIKAYIQLANDSNLSNDTLSVQISNDTAYQLPYFNDFEIANNGWIANGTNSSWEWGIPNGNAIDTAYSGQNAWVTSLDSVYNQNEISYLTSPCLDFSNEASDPIIYFFLNYRTEIHQDKLWLESSIDNGTTWHKLKTTALANNWYNVSSRQSWEGKSKAWQRATNELSNLAGEPRVKLRFVFESNHNIQEEGVGIDDISIIPRQNKDLAINQIIYPTNNSSCGFDVSERIALSLQNYGSSPIDTFKVFYQLDSLPLDSETVIASIDTLLKYKHTSKPTYNLVQQKAYTLKIWVKVNGDTNQLNDTLIHKFNNSTTYSSLSIPFSEDFDDFSNGTANQKGWKADPISFNWNSFGWRAYNNTSPTLYTGPAGDHTNGNGKYIYLESSQNGNDGVFESPCINFNHPDGAVLSFWFHRYGADVRPLLIDYYNGISWVNIETVTQSPQSSVYSSWTYHKVLLPIAGMNTKIRFRGSAQGDEGDQAIDDVKIDPAKIKIINLSQDVICELNDKLAIDLILINNSIINASSGDIVLSYTVNEQRTIYDTLNQSFGINDSILFTFSDSINLNQLNSINTIKIKVEHNNTTLNAISDSLNFDFVHPFVNDNLSENFETYSTSNLNSLWWNFSNGWFILNDTINNITPIKNKTHQGAQFLHSISNNTHNASFESNCLNTRNADSLDLIFWYNIQGTANSKLYVYKKSNSSEVLIDSILGSSSNNQWQRKQVNLNTYLDSTFVLGFRFVDENQNQTTSVNLDDIQLLEQKSPYDARTNEMGVSSIGCDFSSKTISMKIENIGLDSFPNNSIEVYYQIDQNSAVKDSIHQSIALGEVYTHNFSTPANFSQLGNTYKLRLWTNINGDKINNNDTLDTTYTNQLKVGSLFEDFEIFTDYSCLSTFKDEMKNDWYSPNKTWGVHHAGNCSAYPLSGPLYDHTNADGQFVYIETTNNLNKKAELYSSCVDISNVSVPILNYWYHLYGSDIDTLWVEVNLNGQWRVIDSLIGQQQTYAGAPWKQRSIRLNNYKLASPLQFRFSSKINGRFNRLALDDISIADSLTTSVPQLNQSAVNYKLYPNPTEGQFTLDVDQSFLGEIYQIRELSGKIIQEGKINSNKNRIQLNEKAKGIYFLSIPNQNVREKVVVY